MVKSDMGVPASSLIHETPPDYTVPPLGALSRAWVRAKVWRWGGPTEAWQHALHRRDTQFAQQLTAIKISAQGLESYDMFSALQAVDPRFLKWTLDCGANATLQHTNNHRDYLLHRAAVRGWMHRVEMLLDAGADLNVNDNAHSPLGSCLSGFGDGTADWKDRKAVALKLIAAKPDFTLYHWHNRENDFGPCPFDLDVLEALLKGGCDPLTIYNANPDNDYQAVDDEPILLFRASKASNAQELDAFLTLVERYGMGPDTLSRDGSTLPWMMNRSPAMSEDPEGVLEVFQKHGYPLLGTNALGETLLHRAVQHSAVPELPNVVRAVAQVPGMKALATQTNLEGLTALDVLHAEAKEHKFQKTKPYKACAAFLRSLTLEVSFGDSPQASTTLITKPRL